MSKITAQLKKDDLTCAFHSDLEVNLKNLDKRIFYILLLVAFNLILSGVNSIDKLLPVVAIAGQ